MIDKIRSLSKDTLIYGVNTIVGRFLNFVLVPYYTNKFLPEEYGVVALLYSYIAILNVFFSIGLESGYMRFASQMETGTSKENFSNPYLLNVINSFFLGILIFIFADRFAYLFQVGEQYSYLVRYMAAILFFDSVVLIPFAYLRLNNRAMKFSTFKIINIVLNVALNFILISYFKMGIEAIFISNLAASVITFLLVVPIVSINWTFSFNKQLVNDLLKFSLPYIPVGIASNIIQIVDRPILKILSDDKTVGIYQANYKLGIFMMLVVSMFEYAWRPFFLNNAKEKNAKEIFAKVLTAFVIVGSIIVLSLSVFIVNIVKADLPFGFHLIGKDYWGGLDIVPIILFSYLFYGMYINFMAGIYIEKKTSYLSLIALAGAVLNVAGIFILYPLFGLQGVAGATLLSYIVMMASIYFVSNKFYPVKYEWGRIFSIIALMIIVYFVYYFMNRSLNLSWLVKLVFPIAYLFILKALKLFDPKILKRLAGR